MISDFLTKKIDIEVIGFTLYMSGVIEGAMLFALKMQSGKLALLLLSYDRKQDGGLREEGNRMFKTRPMHEA